jgi:hypothetical protein
MVYFHGVQVQDAGAHVAFFRVHCENRQEFARENEYREILSFQQNSDYQCACGAPCLCHARDQFSTQIVRKFNAHKRLLSEQNLRGMA